ncbi:MAG: tRNA (adenosine(37)-N6)-threonylcarbamoyltransferase complex ATPase subunit type 1 TsaE [Candidatus Paceibacterota bacterium]|jgi:tRNA threonylcarbamoyladenosine biosynthesis protein TsaE
MIFISTSADATKAFAREVLTQIKPDTKQATVLALSGDLGAGKTAFTQGLATALGIKSGLTSPTFVLSKKYKIAPAKAVQTGFKQLVHFDFYRLRDIHDLGVLGWSDLLTEPRNLIVVEWPEQVGGKLAKKTKQINFTHLELDERKIEATWLKKISNTN